MVDHIAPNVNNYIVGKGNAYFTPTGGVRRHLGNCPAFEVELGVEELEHFSSMAGVRTKDLVVVIEKSVTLRLTLEEWNSDNLSLALLGEIENDTAGNQSIEIFSQNLVRGRLEFIASNDIGPKWDFDFPQVAFRPSAALSPISDEWGTIEMEGEVEAVEGKFGRATLQDSNETTEGVTT